MCVNLSRVKGSKSISDIELKTSSNKVEESKLVYQTSMVNVLDREVLSKYPRTPD